MNKLKRFIYKDNNYKIYYLAEKECDNIYDISRQIWHREDGPAYIEYDKNGRIRYKAYRVNDKLHREDGSARIWYDKDFNIQCEDYWLDDNEYTKQEYNRELRKRNTKIGRELYD